MGVVSRFCIFAKPAFLFAQLQSAAKEAAKFLLFIGSARFHAGAGGYRPVKTMCG